VTRVLDSRLHGNDGAVDQTANLTITVIPTKVGIQF